ncbi:MAG: LLM class F420-dependent oxidoreductase, partial [Candidatus Limnocylindrales bacterium]
MRPFFGYHMPNYTFDGVADVRLFEGVVERAQAAEAAGFDMVTVMDHFYQIGVVGREDEPMLEAYT